MLIAAFGLLLMTALFGSVIAAQHLRLRPPVLPIGAAHGLLGLTGLVALLFALQGPPRGAAMGVAAFGWIAATLIFAALLTGYIILAMRLRYRQALSIVIGIHATIAVSGVVMLAAYILVS